MTRQAWANFSKIIGLDPKNLVINWPSTRCICNDKDLFVDFKDDQSLIHVRNKDHDSDGGIGNVCLASDTDGR